MSPQAIRLKGRKLGRTRRKIKRQSLASQCVRGSRLRERAFYRPLLAHASERGGIIGKADKRPGRTPLGRGDIGPQTLGLGHRLGNLALHQVADGDDPGQMPVDDDRQVADAAVGHALEQ